VLVRDEVLLTEAAPEPLEVSPKTWRARPHAESGYHRPIWACGIRTAPWSGSTWRPVCPGRTRTSPWLVVGRRLGGARCAWRRSTGLDSQNRTRVVLL